MDIQNEIIKSIDIIVQKYLERYQFLDAESVVLEVKNNKYKVNINGGDYYVKDGVGINPTVGTAVWIHIPNGDIKNAYISARK